MLNRRQLQRCRRWRTGLPKSWVHTDGKSTLCCKLLLSRRSLVPGTMRLHTALQRSRLREAQLSTASAASPDEKAYMTCHCKEKQRKKEAQHGPALKN